MKRKMLAILLTFAMIVSMSMTAFASPGGQGGGCPPSGPFSAPLCCEYEYVPPLEEVEARGPGGQGGGCPPCGPC